MLVVGCFQCRVRTDLGDLIILLCEHAADAADRCAAHVPDARLLHSATNQNDDCKFWRFPCRKCWQVQILRLGVGSELGLQSGSGLGWG